MKMASDAEMARMESDYSALREYFAAHKEFPKQERWFYVLSNYSGPTAKNVLWKLESRRQRTEFEAHDFKDTCEQLNPGKTYFVVSMTADEAKILHGDS